MNDRYWVALFLGCMLVMSAGIVLADGPAELYESAFRHIVEGDYGEAYEQLGELLAQYPDTPYARMAMGRRRRLERLDLSSIRRRQIDQSGRIESVVFSMFYSTWLGVGTAKLLDSGHNEKAVAAGMMIGAPIGLLTSLALTRDARLSDGQAALINFSGYWGTWQGYGWSILLDDHDDERTRIAGAMAGGLLGLAATSALTRHLDLTTGDAGLINYGGLWGSWFALCGADIADVDDDNMLLALVLVGGNLGVAAMAKLAPRTDTSLARASLINLGGIVGTITAAGLLLIAQPDDTQAALAVLAVGGIVGLAAGASSTKLFDRKALPQQAAYSIPGRADPFTRSPVGHSSLGFTGRSGEIRTNLVSIRF